MCRAMFHKYFYESAPIYLTFHESAPIYQNARHSNFDHKLDYMKQAPQKTRRNRQRNIIWFNPSIQQKRQNKHRTQFPMPDRQTFPT